MSYFGTQIPLQSAGGMVRYERKILNTQTGKNPINSVKRALTLIRKKDIILKRREEKRREEKRREEKRREEKRREEKPVV